MLLLHLVLRSYFTSWNILNLQIFNCDKSDIWIFTVLVLMSVVSVVLCSGHLISLPVLWLLTVFIFLVNLLVGIFRHLAQKFVFQKEFSTVSDKHLRVLSYWAQPELNSGIKSFCYLPSWEPAVLLLFQGRFLFSPTQCQGLRLLAVFHLFPLSRETDLFLVIITLMGVLGYHLNVGFICYSLL